MRISNRTPPTLKRTILVAALLGTAGLVGGGAAAGFDSVAAAKADGQIVFASRRDGDSEIYPCGRMARGCGS